MDIKYKNNISDELLVSSFEADLPVHKYGFCEPYIPHMCSWHWLVQQTDERFLYALKLLLATSYAANPHVTLFRGKPSAANPHMAFACAARTRCNRERPQPNEAIVARVAEGGCGFGKHIHALVYARDAKERQAITLASKEAKKILRRPSGCGH